MKFTFAYASVIGMAASAARVSSLSLNPQSVLDGTEPEVSGKLRTAPTRLRAQDWSIDIDTEMFAEADDSTDQLAGDIDIEKFTEAYDSTDELTGDIDTEMFTEAHHSTNQLAGDNDTEEWGMQSGAVGLKSADQGGILSTVDDPPPSPVTFYHYPQAMLLDSSGKSQHTSFPWFKDGYCVDSKNQYFNFTFKSGVRSAQLCQNVCLGGIFANGLVGFNYKRTTSECRCLIHKAYYPSTGNGAPLPVQGMGPIVNAKFFASQGDWRCFRRVYALAA